MRDKILIAIILAAILGGLGYSAFRRNDPADPPKRTIDAQRILKDLPTDAVAANDAFLSRILSEFPISTQEAVLVKELSAQGFISDGWFGQKRMTFVGFSLKANTALAISPQASSGRRMTEIA